MAAQVQLSIVVFVVSVYRNTIQAGMSAMHDHTKKLHY